LHSVHTRGGGFNNRGRGGGHTGIRISASTSHQSRTSSPTPTSLASSTDTSFQPMWGPSEPESWQRSSTISGPVKKKANSFDDDHSILQPNVCRWVYHGKQYPKAPLMLISNYSDTVTIIAELNDDVESFLVHKELVYHYSPVLKAAFESPLIEGQSQVYKLDDTRPETVRLLIGWLYTQQLSGRIGIGSETETALNEANMYRRVLAELWILADKLLMPRLQNATIRLLETVNIKIFSLRKDFDTRFTYEDVKYIYDNTSAESALRMLCVLPHISAQANDNLPIGSYRSLPAEFWINVATFAIKLVSSEEKPLVGASPANPGLLEAREL